MNFLHSFPFLLGQTVGPRAWNAPVEVLIHHSPRPPVVKRSGSKYFA